MVTLDKVYNANLENEEMLAYVALYRVLVESQEDCWDTWHEYAKSLSAKDRLQMQKRFLIFAKSDVFTTLNRVAIDKDTWRIVGGAKSFAIDYCKRNESFPYDFC